MYRFMFTRSCGDVCVADFSFKLFAILGISAFCWSCELLEEHVSFDTIDGLFDVETGSVDKAQRATATPEEIAITAALLESAAAAEQQYRYEIAAVHYQRLTELDPENVQATLGLARNLRYVGSPKDAVLFLKARLSQQEKESVLRVELVKAQIASGLLNDAEEGLATLDELASTAWEFHALHGVLYDHLGRFEDAQNSYGAALEFSPKNVSVLNNLSISLAQAGKLDEAISLLKDLVSSEYANAQMRQNLALLYGLKGDLEEARSLANEDLPPETVAQNLEAFRMLHE
jgi:Flp pilus assembly protein TadD